MTSESGDIDSPWKAALEHFLEAFLSLCYPEAHAGIDWRRGYQSLDKELQQIIRDAKLGRRLADKLFKVWRKDGTETWLLIHVEVQGRRERAFAERMFVYSYRIYDLYRRPVMSLAVLCDDQPGWRPYHFEYNVWGCRVGIHFPAVKLLDYRGREEELEQSPNPFASVILAQLKLMETRGSPRTRQQWKVRLVKGLYERGLKPEQVRQLFRVLDWLLTLPDELEESFRIEMYEFEEEKRMPRVVTIESMAWEKGRKEGVVQGIHESIAWDLEDKFGSDGRKLLPKIEKIKDADRIRSLAKKIKKAATISEIRALLREAAS
jgi:hypothetical protein